MASLAAVLPLALLARAEGLLGGRAAAAWIAAGLLFLAVVTLVREAIGIMGFLVTLALLAWSRMREPSTRRIARLLAIAVVALAAFTAPRWTVAARDAAFDMAPSERLQRHGLSHTLYISLGFVENKFGIHYDDDLGLEVARRHVPVNAFILVLLGVIAESVVRALWASLVRHGHQRP